MPDTQAPATLEALRTRIARIEPELPRRLRDCAAYVMAQSDRIAFDTVAQTAAGAGVQPSALIRFAKSLGFSGFSEMQRLFRSGIGAPRPDYQSRLATLRELGEDAPESLLADFSEAAKSSIEAFAARVDRAMLGRAVDLLSRARMIHIVGQRRSFAMASHMAYLLSKLDRPACLHDGIGAIGSAPLLRRGDALIAISFAPYAPETLALTRAARARGVAVVALTDTALSPLQADAAAIFEIREEEVGGFRSFAATFCLATTLCVAVGASGRAKDAG